MVNELLADNSNSQPEYIAFNDDGHTVEAAGQGNVGGQSVAADDSAHATVEQGNSVSQASPCDLVVLHDTAQPCDDDPCHPAQALDPFPASLCHPAPCHDTAQPCDMIEQIPELEEVPEVS